MGPGAPLENDLPPGAGAKPVLFQAVVPSAYEVPYTGTGESRFNFQNSWNHVVRKIGVPIFRTTSWPKFRGGRGQRGWVPSRASDRDGYELPANITLDDGLILPHRANPTGPNFRERHPDRKR